MLNETDDRTLILADISRKAQVQVREFVEDLLCRRMPDERAGELATMLSEYESPRAPDRPRSGPQRS